MKKYGKEKFFTVIKNVQNKIFLIKVEAKMLLLLLLNNVWSQLNHENKLYEITEK